MTIAKSISATTIAQSAVPPRTQATPFEAGDAAFAEAGGMPQKPGRNAPALPSLRVAGSVQRALHAMTRYAHAASGSPAEAQAHRDLSDTLKAESRRAETLPRDEAEALRRHLAPFGRMLSLERPEEVAVR